MSAVQTDNNLSFLDTLSCGLGALMVLFFVFAAVSDRGISGAKVRPVISRGETEQAQVLEAGRDKSRMPVMYSLRLSSESCQLSPEGLTAVASGALSLGRGPTLGISEFHGLEWDFGPRSIEFDCAGFTETLTVHATQPGAPPASACTSVSRNSRGFYEIKLQFLERTVVLNGTKTSGNLNDACAA
mgnify:CR=1 FL=1